MLIMLVGFVIILLIVGMFMQSKLKSLLRYYTGQQVTQHAKVLSDLLDEKFTVELTCLEHISIFIEKGVVNKENLLEVFEEMEHCSGIGLLELGGKSVYGESLSIKEFSGIQDSFRGNSAISYSPEKGLLFTVPVYSNENVRYVLYKFYENELLSEAFSISCYDGAGSVFITNRNAEVIIPTENRELEQFLFSNSGVKKVYEQIQKELNIMTATSARYEREDGFYYLFVSEIGVTDFLLVGTVPREIVSEGMTHITVLIWWVFGLLLLLLAIIFVFLFGA